MDANVNTGNVSGAATECGPHSSMKTTLSSVGSD